MGGSFQLRLFVQPLIGIALGLRYGLRDLRAGREPFLARLRHAKGARGAVLKEGLRDTIIALIVAFLLDCVLQYMTLKYVRPLAAVVVGALLVFVPFAITRELSNRLWRRRRQRRQHAHA